MTRREKIALIAGWSLAGVLLVLGIVAILIVRSAWFSNYVRGRIVASVEQATGGKVGVKEFHFNWLHLRADLSGFTIHGLEPPGAAPLLTVRHVRIDLGLAAPFTKPVHIAYLLVEEPRANIMILPNGRTNIPAPMRPRSNPLDTVVHLAIGRFDVVDGAANFADRKARFNASGQNLRAHLTFNHAREAYRGEIDIDPLLLRSANREPVAVKVVLPVAIDREKIAVANAQLTTALSRVVFTGDVRTLLSPRASGRVYASVALDELRRVGLLPIAPGTGGGPRIVNADITGSMDAQRVAIQHARVRLGGSELEAHGVTPAGELSFRATLLLGQLGRSLKLPLHAEGTMNVEGAAAQRPRGWQVNAKLAGQGLGFTQGTTHVAGLNLATEVAAAPGRIELKPLALSGIGGTFTGSAVLENLRTFRVAGDLHHFDFQTLASALLGRRLSGYSGEVSGPIQIQGDLEDRRAIVGRATLAIAPGGGGIPVAGRIALDYNARADTVVLGPSVLRLPHSRIDLAGALGRRIDVRLMSSDLADFRPLGVIPVALHRGTATLTAAVTGSLSDPHIAAHAALTNFAVEGREFTRFAGDIEASRSRVAVANALVTRGTLAAQFSGSLGLDNWKTANYEPLRIDAVVRNADVADVLALAGQRGMSASGTLAAEAHIAGTLGSPTGSAEISAARGSIEGVAFDTLTARAAMTPESIDVPAFALTAGPARIDAAAAYRHARNDLSRGTLWARVASNQVQLADYQQLLKNRPGLRGVFSLNAEGTFRVAPSPAGARFEVASLNGQLAVHGLAMGGRNLGDLTASASTAANAIDYRLVSDFAGSAIQVSGRSLLTGSHETTASARIANLPIEPALELAGQGGLPLAGTLSATAQLSGTLQDPRVAATVTVVKGAAWRQPFDRVEASFRYSNTLLDVASFRATEQSSTLTASGSFAHPAGDYQDGQLRFRAESNPVPLGQIQAVQDLRPGLAGTVRLTADGSLTLRRGAAPLPQYLNADLSARGVSVNGQALGDLTAKASTRGQTLDFELASNFAGSDIRGTGRVQLAGDYPIDAHVNFANVTYAGLAPLAGAPPEPIVARADGTAAIAGPLARAADLRGSLRLARLEAHAVPTGIARPRVQFEVHNAAPIVAALNRSVLTIQSAHLTGPFADLTVSGTASIAPPFRLDLRAGGKFQLDLLEAFSPDIYSAGNIVLTAAVTGTAAQPSVTGRLELQKASLNVAGVPNGLSNGNGVVTFAGTQAIIQNLTGESGGGKVSIGGIVNYGGPEMQVRLNATAEKVLVAYPEPLSMQVNAKLTLTGTTSHSVLAGSVSVLNVALREHADVGSLLTTAATPPLVANPRSGFLAGMHFDIRIATAPDVQFRTTLTQNLQADANLTLRGTPDQPGILGRINITEGTVIFFGGKYNIEQGSIAFYDPNRIRPYLNIALETTVQQIDISLSVSGPMDRLKLSYRSDPPMQFTDLVALLATGRPPVTDPVLASTMPAPPLQNFQQKGASALFGAAVASPVSGRLERLFGITSLRISPELNPRILGAPTTAQASMTLQQQVTKDITFTYTQDVAQANPTIVSVEWDFAPRWSVIAQRDYNGFFAIDFLWKKRFP
ncbi:MAG TPA: translocation/assembly module TamB domain-containing protein [Bryobacteraceae bacterium]|nr:translocation/assembly module TamB domain-containing protein [Bryobacteraceae bacterium]